MKYSDLKDAVLHEINRLEEDQRSYYEEGGLEKAKEEINLMPSPVLDSPVHTAMRQEAYRDGFYAGAMWVKEIELEIREK